MIITLIKLSAVQIEIRLAALSRIIPRKLLVTHKTRYILFHSEEKCWLRCVDKSCSTVTIALSTRLISSCEQTRYFRYSLIICNTVLCNTIFICLYIKVGISRNPNRTLDIAAGIHQLLQSKTPENRKN